MINGAGNTEDYTALKSAVYDLATVVYGNPAHKIVGVVDKLDKLIDAEERRALREAEMRAQLRGIVIGLGFTGITSAGTLITVLARIFAGIP